MANKARRRARAAVVALRRDFVQLTEADLTYSDRTDRVRDAIRLALGGDWDDRWLWVRDITDDWATFEDDGNTDTPGLWEISYTLDDAGSCTIIGPAMPKMPVTTYVDDPDRTALAIGAPAPVVLEIQSDESARDLVGDTIPLIERAVRGDGTIQIKVIEEGEGSSGYYSADVLKRDGPNAFPGGTHMFWNHPSISEAMDRPERDLRDLAATTVADAYWQENGPAGAGLYTDAKVFDDYASTLESIAPHIGVSIRARGRGHDGIIDEIVSSESIDFVTVAGAGGEVVSLFEAARGHRRPTPIPAPTPAPKKESQVDLQEATTKISALEANKTTLETNLTEATALGALASSERDRLREATILRDARDLCVFGLAEAKYANVPDMTKARIIREASTNPALAADGTLDVAALGARFEESVKAEITYLATTTGRGLGRVAGLGGTGDIDLGESVPANADELDADLEEAFGNLGLSESAAKTAAAGRK